MSINVPNNINEAIKILAYNEWVWDHGINFVPHPKDKATVISLAEAQYPWTEKQGRLAVSIVKRYLTKFETVKMDLKALCDNPVFDAPFRIISSAKTIESVQDSDGNETLEMQFPYDQKIVKLIRCCKEYKSLPARYFTFEREDKIWSIVKTDVTTYYMTLIAARYNFTFVSEQLLDEHEEIKKEKLAYKRPQAVLQDEKIVLKNVPESLTMYWQENIANKKTLVQLDYLKNFAIPQTGIKVKADSEIADKIAHNSNTKLWIDKNAYTKDKIINGLGELDCFPIVMTIAGEVTDNKEDINEILDWINCFKRHGLDEHKNISWGFELREPKQYKDQTEEERFFNSHRLDDATYLKAFDLYQLSKNFKHVDNATKIYFVRNKITRALMRSKLKFKCSLIALGGGYYDSGGENIKRLLDNLPKKLYYSNAQPDSWQWNHRAIIKL